MRPGDYDSDSQRKISWKLFAVIWPYLLEYRLRVALAVSCLILSKAASVSGPFLLKHIVDSLSQEPNHSAATGAGWANCRLWLCAILNDYAG
jgi:ATP-binding cassette subfamily B protein